MSSTIESLRQEYRLILRTRSLNLWRRAPWWLYSDARTVLSTIPRTMLLRLQDSSQHDTQNNQNQRIGMILHEHLAATSPDNCRICRCWCGDDSYWISVQTVFEHFWIVLRALSPRSTKSGHNLIPWSMYDSSANRRWACSNLAFLSCKDSGTKRWVEKLCYSGAHKSLTSVHQLPLQNHCFIGSGGGSLKCVSTRFCAEALWPWILILAYSHAVDGSSCRVHLIFLFLCL